MPMSCDSRRRLSPSTREAKLCTRPGQDDKARVVGDQMQAPELLLRRPADPAIGAAGTRRAAIDQCEPGLP